MSTLLLIMASHLDDIQADRELQHWGYGVRQGNNGWHVYEWERESELSIRTQPISEDFSQKWEAEHFLNLLKRR